MPPLILKGWDGTYWQFWTLLAGCLLTIASLALGSLIAALLGQDARALMMLLLLAELLIFSVAGSGLLDSMSRRMSRGGLARETADLDALLANDSRQAELEEVERARRDRRTVRAGLLTLPLLLTFGYLLFTS